MRAAGSPRRAPRPGSGAESLSRNRCEAGLMHAETVVVQAFRPAVSGRPEGLHYFRSISCGESSFRRTSWRRHLWVAAVLCLLGSSRARTAAPALAITDTARSLQPGEVVVLTIGTETRADSVH